MGLGREAGTSAQAFNHLERARRRGFALHRNGPRAGADPAFYRPGSRVTVTVRGIGGTSRTRTTVGRSGRLRVDVPLSDGATPETTSVSIR